MTKLILNYCIPDDKGVDWNLYYGEQPYPTPEFDGCMLLLNEGV